MADRRTQPTPRAAAEAALVASRALVAVSARSMQALDDVTLPQFRALVILASRGPITSSDLAAALHVHASSVTRLVDRLAAKGLVQRTVPGDRREVVVGTTTDGVAVVRAVTDARRDALTEVMGKVPAARRAAIVTAFEEFAAAAGEIPDDQWATILHPPDPAG